MNCKELSACLKDGEAYLVFSEVNRRYLTSFPATDGWLLLTNKERYLFADSRYNEAAEAQAKDISAVVLLKDFKAQIKEFCEKLHIKKVYIEDDRMTVSLLSKLKKALDGIEVDFTGTLSEKLNAFRAVKSADEVEKIIAAQRIAEAAFEKILKFMKPGVTERETALELDYLMLRGGAEAVSFDTIVVSGANSSMPHGVPGEKKLVRGDFVTLDFGAVVDGWHSDMTRTVAIGEAGKKQREVYDTVLRAQLAAAAAVRPGALCREVDRAARDIIVEAGYGERFGHSTGHGVGLEIHEEPSLSPKSGDAVLEPGNIVTDEPGIYIPGEFGVRIEDMLLVTENGAENLTRTPKELIIIE